MVFFSCRSFRITINFHHYRFTNIRIHCIVSYQCRYPIGYSPFLWFVFPGVVDIVFAVVDGVVLPAVVAVIWVVNVRLFGSTLWTWQAACVFLYTTTITTTQSNHRILSRTLCCSRSLGCVVPSVSIHTLDVAGRACVCVFVHNNHHHHPFECRRPNPL